MSAVITCRDPIDPAALYVRRMYREYFYGPFADEAAVVVAIAQMLAEDPYWDYDFYVVHHGADPLPTCYVTGFQKPAPGVRERIHKAVKEIITAAGRGML